MMTLVSLRTDFARGDMSRGPDERKATEATHSRHRTGVPEATHSRRMTGGREGFDAVFERRHIRGIGTGIGRKQHVRDSHRYAIRSMSERLL